MNKNFKRTTVTAALPYANGGVHIGHLAGVYVPADIYVRYLRLKKQEVIFMEFRLIYIVVRHRISIINLHLISFVHCMTKVNYWKRRKSNFVIR